MKMLIANSLLNMTEHENFSANKYKNPNKLLNIAEHENLSATKYENANNNWHFLIY